VIVMSSFFGGQGRRTCAPPPGISYEGAADHRRPRNLPQAESRRPIDRIGVVATALRSPASWQRQAALRPTASKTAVVREEVSQSPNASEIKRAAASV